MRTARLPKLADNRTDSARRRWMIKVRFPGGYQCPRCGRSDCHTIPKDAREIDKYYCPSCREAFTSRLRTALHNRKWRMSDLYIAIHCVSARSNRERLTLPFLLRSLGRDEKSLPGRRHAKKYLFAIYDAWTDLHPEFAAQIPGWSDRRKHRFPQIDAEPHEIAAALFELRF